MPSLKFTFEDILQEIERLNEEKPDGFTIHEMSKALQRDSQWCREQIRSLIEAGKGKYNGKRKIMRMDNSVGYSPVYTLIDKKRK